MAVPHFFDQAMQTQPLQQARDLPAGPFPQMGAQTFVLQAAQVEFSLASVSITAWSEPEKKFSPG